MKTSNIKFLNELNLFVRWNFMEIGYHEYRLKTISLWILALWRARADFKCVTNPHLSHWYSLLSSKCRFLCAWRSAFLLDAYGQISHLKRLTSLWVRICFSRRWSWLVVKAQWLQFSRWANVLWRASSRTCVASNPHFVHLKLTLKDSESRVVHDANRNEWFFPI